jgi:hypothetical protein
MSSAAFHSSILQELKDMLELELGVQTLQVEVFEGRCERWGTPRRAKKFLGVEVDRIEREVFEAWEGVQDGAELLRVHPDGLVFFRAHPDGLVFLSQESEGLKERGGW